MGIVIKPSNPQWKEEFCIFKNYLKSIPDFYNADIQHIGSTSIEGLSAKPILDIDIIVKNEAEKQAVIIALSKIGYTHIGDLGIKGREAFKLDTDKTVPFLESFTFKRNIYVCIEGVTSLENHLKFRDYLREHPEDIEIYSNLKIELAEKHANDIDSYTEAKTAFITDILHKCGFTKSDISDISEQNRK